MKEKRFKKEVVIKTKRHDELVIKKNRSKNGENQIIVRNNRFNIKFNTQTKDDCLIVFSDGHHEIKLTPRTKQNDIKPVNINNMVTYPNIFDKADLCYLVSEKGMKEEIVVLEKKDEYKFQFEMQLKNLYLDLSETGIQVFRDLETKEDIFVIPKMEMYDAVDSQSNDILLTIDSQNEINILTVIADSSWVNAEQRVFPIRIDPQIEIVNSDPVSISSVGYNGGQQYEIGGKIRTGRYKKTVPIESYMYNKIQITVNTQDFLDLINDEREFNCQLKLFHTKPTTENYNGITDGFAIKFGSIQKVIVYPTEAGSITVNITKELKERIAAGSTSNLVYTLEHVNPLGVQLAPGSSSSTTNVGYYDDFMEVFTPNSTLDTMQPQLVIRYIGDGALEEGTPMMKLNNRRSGIFEMNPFTGDFTHHHYNATISSGALKVDLMHVYDSAFRMSDIGSSNVFGLGKGWKTNLHQRLFKSKYFNNATKGREVIYTDGNGKNHYLYEKWYIEVNGEKLYEQVDREFIYLDSDNKLKINIAGTIHEVKYEVKSDDGLELMLSSSMVSYLDKKRFKKVRTYNVSYLDGLRVLIYNESNNTVQVKVPRKSFTEYHASDREWIKSPLVSTHTLPSNIFMDLTEYFKPSEVNYNTGEAPNTFHLPVLFDGTDYYVNLPHQHYTPLIYWDDFQELGSGYQKYTRINLNVTDKYEFDPNVDINDIMLSQDLETVEQQIKSYENAINDVEKNMISVSEQYDKVNFELEKQIKNFVRSDASNFLNEESIKRKISDTNLRNAELNDTRYNALTAKNNFVNSINSVKTSLSDNSKNMGILQKRYQEYKQELDHLKDKYDDLVKQQKGNPVDFIIDRAQNILGFDYSGRLILIRDTYENQIEVIYKENTEQLTEIITKNGKVLLNYSKVGNLESIIDEQGRQTSLIYNGSNNLIEISYHRIEGSTQNTKFSYLNDQLSEIIDSSKLRISISKDDALQITDLKQSTVAVLINNDGIVSDNSNEKIVFDHEIAHGIGTTKITDKLTEMTTLYTFDHKHRVTNVIDDSSEYQSFSYAKYNAELCEFEISGNDLEVVQSVSLINNQLSTTNQGVGFQGINLKNKIKSDLLMLAVYFNDNQDLQGKSIELCANVTYASETKSFTFETPCIVDNERFVALPIPIDKQKLVYLDLIFRSSAITPVKKVELLSASGSKYFYDDNDKLIKVESGLSIVEYFNYVDDKPLRVKSQDRFGKVVETIFMYNTINQETYREDSEGNITETIYNEKGQVVESVSYHKDAASEKTITRTSYDDLGHPVSLDSALPSKGDMIHQTELLYHKGSEMLSKVKEPNGLVTTFGYDFITGELLEKSASVNGYNNKATYKYQFGLLTSLTHHGLTIRYDLDGLGRKKKIFIGNQEMVSLVYDDEFIVNDKKGSKIVSTYANGLITEVINDYDGKLQSIKTLSNNQVIEHIVYTYDIQGKLLTETSLVKTTDKTVINYDHEDRIASQTTTFDGNDNVTEWLQYDEKNRIIEHEMETPNSNRIHNFEYNEKNQLVVAVNGGDQLRISYDALNRISKKKTNIYNGAIFTDDFTYLKAEEQSTNLVKKHVSKIEGLNQNVAIYDYDESGNITHIETDDYETRYGYDKLGRLIREDNKELDKTFIFDYDESGNILFKKIYSYTMEKPYNKIETVEYGYRSDEWKDQLVSFNGTQMSYDIMGNPLIYKNQSLTWSKQGRLLSFGQHQYVYNKQGLRIKKTVNGIVTKFFLSGTKVLGSMTGSNFLEFTYLGNQVIGLWYNNSKYLYRRNIQGDIISLHEPDGTLVAKYIYDAWGNHKVLDDSGIENTNPSFIGNINPIRYRGYYYDVETKLYYLNTRYYDPETGRFISADTLAIIDETQADINGLNLYMYCGNNPVMLSDSLGCSPYWDNFWKVLGGVALISALVVGTVLTGGVLSVVLAGAAIGAISGAIGATVSTTISGDWSNFGNSFLMGTIVGGISGAIAASPLGIGMQIGINAALGVANYAITTAINGGKITLGGLLFSGATGGLAGLVGGAGFMKGNTIGTAAAAFGAKNFFNVIGTNFMKTGLEIVVRNSINAFVVGGALNGVYAKLSNLFNSEGKFIGW